MSELYLQDCELRLFSPSTITTRRVFFRNLGWFLRTRGFESCGTWEIRQFLYYLAHGHENEGGRFGKPELSSPARPVTIKDYYLALRCLFDWLTAQGFLTESPFLAIPKPQVRDEVKMPLSEAQIGTLFRAAGATKSPLRDIAILSLLLDTGCRASELVSLRRGDIDVMGGHCRVLGKGNKYRTLYFGEKTSQALTEYLATVSIRGFEGDGSEFFPLFLSASNGRTLNQPLRLSGLQQLLKRLKKECGIRISCSPHAFRRAFAVQTLKNGANVFSVQAILGHTDLEMTQLYCALAVADVEAQHRRFSPLDRFDGFTTAHE